MNDSTLQKVDHSKLKTNQAVIIGLLLLSFLINQPPVLILALIGMAVGTLVGVPGFGFIYVRLLKPLNIVQPAIHLDHPEPHRFSQGLGAFVIGLSIIAFLVGAATLGWSLAWLVIVLASLNLFAGFCAGCAVYYWLNRLNIRGFEHPSPPGVRAGFMPSAIRITTEPDKEGRS